MIIYKLQVKFTNDQLKILYATGTNVILSKPLHSDETRVAWQCIRPFQNNEASWKDEYGIYVSKSPITDNQQIIKLSSEQPPVYEKKSYTIESSGVISGPYSSDISAGYQLINAYSFADYLTAGLTQDATVNGIKVSGNIISASRILKHSSKVMLPSMTAYIWLQSNIKTNTPTRSATSPVCELRFTEHVTSISISYDSATGHFTQDTQGSHSNINTITPHIL